MIVTANRTLVNGVWSSDPSGRPRPQWPPQFLILGIVLVYATLLILFNLIVDVAYAWLDPRIDLER